MKKKAYLLSLGCPKNLVDSEYILETLSQCGYQIVEQMDNGQQADVAIVNTCAFIEEAKEESIEAILQLGRLKETGQIKSLIVAGCLPQRYQQELVEHLPEVDVFLGTGSLSRIREIIANINLGQKICDFDNPAFLNKRPSKYRFLTPRHFTYVKIAEGCDNRCHYCIIHRLRGPYRSRPIESIVEEVKLLADDGVVEVNLVSQDSGYYGNDLYGRSTIASLLRHLNQIKDIKWIRLLYTHPAHVNDELIKSIADLPKVCKYIDLPLQHINDNILRSMGRKTTKQRIMKLLTALRKNIPGLAIRTTFIVGLPGEGDKEFNELIDFVKEIKFERLGAFIYSREQGTQAANYSQQVPEDIKKERFDYLMSLQQEIATELNRQLKGKDVSVLIDEKDNKPGWFVGRTQADAPEVDGQVWVKASSVSPGQILEVKITDTYEYDLVGTQV